LQATLFSPTYCAVTLSISGKNVQSFKRRQKSLTEVQTSNTPADVLLVPFVPRSFDVWMLEKVSNLVAEMRAANPALKAYAFINRADPRGQDNDEAADVIRETQALTFIDTPLGTRKAFSNAAAQGLAVTEIKPQDAKAAEEIMILFGCVFDSKQI
jgi:chromosome partitioning protein